MTNVFASRFGIPVTVTTFRPGSKSRRNKLTGPTILMLITESPEIPVGTATVHVEGKEYDAQLLYRCKQQLELRTLADWVIRPRLLKTTGVAEVFMQGGDRKQYQILIDPTALLGV